jgi:hypothetical protein
VPKTNGLIMRRFLIVVPPFSVRTFAGGKNLDAYTSMYFEATRP